jgi:hypothetical protein
MGESSGEGRRRPVLQGKRAAVCVAYSGDGENRRKRKRNDFSAPKV